MHLDIWSQGSQNVEYRNKPGDIPNPKLKIYQPAGSNLMFYHGNQHLTEIFFSLFGLNVKD